MVSRIVCVGAELSSRVASHRVLSPQQSLTSVFGMGTGGPSALKSLTSVIKKDHREPKKKTSRQCVVANLNLEVQALGQLVPVS